MPSLSAILAIVGLLGTIGSGTGAWFYRANIDDKQTQAALDARSLAEQQSIEKAYAKGRADSDELATDQQQRAQQFEQDLAKEKADHANDIKTAHADLVRAVGKCTVRRSDLSVLDASSPVPGPAATPAAAPAGQQRDDTGSVDAATVIETCERNRTRFDANLGRLEQCVAAYDAVRAKLSSGK